MNLIEELCKDQPKRTQEKIKAAYWHGCVEGMSLANSKKHKIDHKDGNVVYLRQNK